MLRPLRWVSVRQRKSVRRYGVIHHLPQLGNRSNDESRTHSGHLDTRRTLEHVQRSRSGEPFALDNLVLREQPEEIFHPTAEGLRKPECDGSGRKILIGFDGMDGLPGNTGLGRKFDTGETLGLPELTQ